MQSDRIPSVQQIARARAFLARYLTPTRTVTATSLSIRFGVPAYLKLEGELPTGSFKVRGALFALAMRMREEEVKEVVTSSTGNHGAAVAYAASVLDVRATIFLPENPNPTKRKRIADLGANIVETGNDLAAAAEAAHEYARAQEAYLLSDVTDPQLPAGPATIAAELIEQAPDITTVIVPVGDTALIRGIGAVAKQHTPVWRVIGVQAEQAPAYYRSWLRGTVVETETCNTIADGLATRTPDGANVQAIREVVDDFVLVSEQQLVDAMRILLHDEGVVAEPAGAAATAAALALPSLSGPTALLVTGANVAPS